MNPLIVYAVSACSGGTCAPVPVQQPQPAQVVVVGQPRPFAGLFQPRPQFVIVQPVQAAPNCAGGKCR